MDKARETFYKYDKDKDGSVSSGELYDILKGHLIGLCSVEEAETKSTNFMSKLPYLYLYLYNQIKEYQSLTMNLFLNGSIISIHLLSNTNFVFFLLVITTT